MIIPTPEYDPLFADDGVPFRSKMIQYIEREFSDLLNDRRGLLHIERGLEMLSAQVRSDAERDASRHAA